MIAGLFAGVISSVALMSFRIEPELARLSARVSNIRATSTAVATSPRVEIIPIETRPLLSALPSAFDERRRSPVLRLIEVSQTTKDTVVEKQNIGVAISVTSDGWLMTSHEAVVNANLAKWRIAYQGSILPIKRAIYDKGTNVVYMKIEASGLPVVDMLPARDITPGAAVWTEREASVLRPASIMSVRARKKYSPVSSEEANRRYWISGSKEDGIAGEPVWDGRAKLIGMYEGYNEQTGAWLVQPVSSVARDLAKLLSAGKITHAGLSIFALDLEGVVLANRPEALPDAGAWLRPGKNVFTIAKNSPPLSKLKTGDVIERIERDILDGEADLGEILLEYRPGANVTLTVLRGKEEKKIELTLNEIQTSIDLLK